MRRENVGRAALIVLLAFNLYLVYLIFKPLLPGISWAVVLAVAFQPLYARLVRWLRGWEWTAAALLSGVVAAFIVVPSALAIVRIGNGLVQAYEWLKANVSSEGSLLERLRALPVIGPTLDRLDGVVDLEKIDLQGMALSVLKTLGNTAASRTSAFVADALATLVTVAVMLVTMTVLFREGPRLMNVVRRLLPLAEGDREAALKQLQQTTRAVFFGVLLTALVQAILGGIGTAIVGLPSPITFGAAMFFAALLPAGTAIVWGPAAIWLLVSGSPWKALFLAAWGIVVVSMVDNFLRPFFIGKGVQLHSLLVFFSIFGGMLAFGLVGLFAGPLVLTLFLFLLDVVRRDFFPEGLTEERGTRP